MLTESTITRANKYCKDYISSIENYKEAISSDKKYVCHHKLGIKVSKEELKEEGLYYNRPASELIFLEISEHSRLHKEGENNPMYGKHLSYETRQKLSDNLKGKNKGEKHPMAKQCNINGKIYGCLKDAYEDIKPNISYRMFCIKYKECKL